LIAIAAAWIGVSASFAAPEAESPPAVSEERFEEIFQKYEARALEMSENSEADEVVLAEAEEIAAVANEMHEEGDLETAISLLEEAIGLLENSASSD
jgi:hypothetical protein